VPSSGEAAVQLGSQVLLAEDDAINRWVLHFLASAAATETDLTAACTSGI
jgi:hypothetical protein